MVDKLIDVLAARSLAPVYMLAIGLGFALMLFRPNYGIAMMVVAGLAWVLPKILSQSE